MPDQPTEPDDLGTDPDGGGQPAGDIYPVERGPDECAVVEGEQFPRRPYAGRRGIIIVAGPWVYLLDADDTRKVFTPRARRPLTGDPGDLDYPRDGSDHIVRAAYEFEYDVFAAPWSDDNRADPPAVAGGQ